MGQFVFLYLLLFLNWKPNVACQSAKASTNDNNVCFDLNHKDKQSEACQLSADDKSLSFTFIHS